MLIITSPAAIKDHIGDQQPPSEWVTIDQAMINLFAEATGDHQWIHVDVERAARELDGGKTIAHGYLLLSLIPRLTSEMVRVDNTRHILNYGTDKVRFINKVPAGSRVRLRRSFKSAEEMGNGGLRVVAECVMEIEGQDKPALIAETISLLFPS